MPTKQNSVSSTTPLVDKSSSALMQPDKCPKKDVVKAALESELRDVTSIGVPIHKFMRKYFSKWEYPKASSIFGLIISWEEKDFASYIDEVLTLNDQTKPFLRFFSDGLTTPRQTEKEKDRSRLDFFLYEENKNHMVDPSLAKDINWEQICVIMEHTKSKSKLHKIGIGIEGKKLLQLARYRRTVFSHQHNLQLLHGVLFINFERNIIGSLDPKFSNNQLFITLLNCINDQLESKPTPFTIPKKKDTISGSKVGNSLERRS